ncbi:MAG: cytochrome P450 [Alphaproteobacteria bacterium]
MTSAAEMLDQLIQDPWQAPLAGIDPSMGDLFKTQKHHEVFKRLRQESPVHYTPDSPHGPFWSITRFDDIVAVDTDHENFSSAPTITIGDPPDDFVPENFISMDQPKHDVQRLAVQGGVAPKRLQDLEGLIRTRVGDILDGLPRNEEFNWVDHVSREITMRMLATLFDMPQEDRHLLTQWSDTATNSVVFGGQLPVEEGIPILLEALAYFQDLWKVRAQAEPAMDFMSMLAHNPQTSDMGDDPMALLGNVLLLIVGGNDTTRNSISGGLVALNQNPDQYDKLRANPGLIPNMVPEIIRWQTPLSHMRRLAVRDIEFRGRQIKKGDKVVMWYASGNRDEDALDDPYSFRIDRENARRHLSFGFGIHRCMGNRLAEMQLRIVWEEILARFDKVDVVGDPIRTSSAMVNGFDHVPVKIAA